MIWKVSSLANRAACLIIWIGCLTEARALMLCLSGDVTCNFVLHEESLAFRFGIFS